MNTLKIENGYVFFTVNGVKYVCKDMLAALDFIREETK